MMGKSIQHSQQSMFDWIEIMKNNNQSFGAVEHLPDGFKEYIIWKSHNSYNLDQAFLDQITFKQFSNDPGMLEKFIALSFENQHRIIQRMSASVNRRTIRTILDLLDESQVDYSDADMWRIEANYNRRKSNNCPDVSVDFVREYAKFLNFQKTILVDREHFSHILDEVVILLLVKMHGEDKVRLCMDMWRKNKTTNDLRNFKVLVENYDRVRDTYPDWAFEVLGINQVE